MKKVLGLILSFVLITEGFVICPLKIHAGTDPKPAFFLPTDDAEINNSSTAAKDKN